MERVYDREALSLMHRADGVIGPRRDGERLHGPVPRLHDPGNRIRLRSTEKHQIAPVLGLPSSIELQQQPMSLAAGNEVVVDSDRLSRDELVYGYIHPIGQRLAEVPSHPAPKCRQRSRTCKTLDGGGESGVKQAEFVLLVEIRLGQLPGSIRLEPVEPFMAGIRMHAVPHEVLEGPSVVLDRIEIRKHRQEKDVRPESRPVPARPAARLHVV